MEELTQNYPEAARHLHAVPPHISDELGSVAVTLTHEDQHPKKEVTGEYGRTVLQADLGQVITDPEFDASNLETDALAAAESGQKKVAAVLEQSARHLRSGQQALEGSGYKFGPQEVETDERRDLREKAERSAVYDAALDEALQEALSAHADGNIEQSTASLESLIFLRYIKLRTADYGEKEDRAIFRKAVRAGVAHELLAATQNASKLQIGKEYGELNSSLYGLQPLLGYTLGKSFGYEFEDKGYEPSLDTIPSGEDVRDIFAAMTTKDSWLTVDMARDNWRSSTQMIKLMERLKPELSDGVDSVEYYYHMLNDYPIDDLRYVLACTDPRQACDAAQKLGIPDFSVNSMFGEDVEYGHRIPLKQAYIDQMVTFKDQYPYHYDVLSTGQNGVKKFLHEPALIGSCIDGLRAVGVEDPALTSLLAYDKDPAALQAQCLAIIEACRAQNIGYEQFKSMTESVNSFASVIRESSEAPDIGEYVSDLACSADAIDLEIKKLREATYPVVPGFGETVKLHPEEMPRLIERITKTGLPADVASEMLASWATYSAFNVNYYRDDRWQHPESVPDDGTLQVIARNQATALMTQLAALETIADKGGLEATGSIINTFGIYNFARHDPEALIAQEQAWREGKAAKTVIVDARSDWNSYTGKDLKTEDTTAREGIFFFEANSGADTARIAVAVGRHERQQGREPEVERFVVHGHGAPHGILMGVNREAIDTDAYLKAAQAAAKINASEVNDYRRHLGPNFEVILQSCSTGGDNGGLQNIADTISDRHDVRVIASNTTIYGLSIMADGSVKFETRDQNHQQVVYQN